MQNYIRNRVTGRSLLATAVFTSLFLAATSAQAIVTVNAIITATSGSGVISVDELSITGVSAGDTVTVETTVINADLDEILEIFTGMFIDDTSVVTINSGLSGAVNILEEPGFGGSSLIALGTPAQKFGEPVGNIIALAHGSNNGQPTSAPGPALAVQSVFNVVATSDSSATITSGFQTSGDLATVNGATNNSAGAPDVDFSDPIIITVPEPASVLSSLAALAGVGMAVTVRRRAN